MMKRLIGRMAIMMAMNLAVSACQSTPYGITPSQRSSHSDKTQIAQIRTQMAGQYILAGNLDEAKRQLDVAMAADGHFAPSYDMMGVLLQREGSADNLAEADTYFREAIRLDRTFMRAYNNYGVYLVQVGRVREAIAYFEKSGSQLGYDGRIQALENLGLTWQKLGEMSRADDAFYRAIDGGSVNLGIYESVLGRLMTAGDTVRANAVFDKLLMVVLPSALSDDLLNIGIDLAKRSNDAQRLDILKRQVDARNSVNQTRPSIDK